MSQRGLSAIFPPAMKIVRHLPFSRQMNTPRFQPTPIPRERRRRQCARFVLTDARGVDIPVIVRDSSPRGLSATALGQAPGLNEIVRAHLEDGTELWGIVRWQEAQLFGVEFDTRQGE